MSIQINQQKQVLDPNFSADISIPAAGGADVQTTPFDLSQAGDAGLDHIFGELLVDALPNNVTSSISVAVSLYAGATAGSLALFAEVPALSVPGVATTGSAQASFQFRFPPDTPEFVAANVHAPTGVGNNTAQKAHFNIRF
ncbi:hypothetical protein SAMN05444156_3227 [Verrucomicrobium sp. GAS474]|uniref:hypothetical protein n=1 Tax=Verrucomicrobium sp. GAS474 TaxID=1882831 RepID=UPI00087A7F77|nr:hypothetical protein [Verrucomicrobium sp. GAS474]SDU31202.1 hypothetical protein SAMN05444156_3227 [Verrucomicrobium sp. GAS474]